MKDGLCRIFILVLLIGIILVSIIQKKIINKIKIYEQHVVPGLINNANLFRQIEGLQPLNFYFYTSDYNIYR